jgi:ribosomal protein L20A (L18A)
MKYEISGSVRLKGEARKFNVEMDALSEKHLRDKVAAYFGSKYGARRNAIKITEIKKGA